MHGPTLPGHPWWLSHSNTALGQHVLLCWCAEAISIPCNVVVPNHLQTIWFSVTVSYYVEQPPHCDRLRLSLSTGRFVRTGRTHLSYLFCSEACLFPSSFPSTGEERRGEMGGYICPFSLFAVLLIKKQKIVMHKNALLIKK